MPKIQAIKRSDESIIHSVNIPKEIIEVTGWKKGDELNVEAKLHNNSKIVVISKE